MKLQQAGDIFASTVSYLMNATSGTKLFIEKEDYILFKPRSFRTALSKFIEGSNKHNKLIEEYLNVYKILGFIATDKDRTRFTKTQKIDNKTIKVIAVNRKAYELLVDIQKEEKEG